MSEIKEVVRGGSFIIPGDVLAEIFTIADLTEEQVMIRKMLNEFMTDNVITDEAVRRIEGKDWDFTRKLLLELGKLGVLGAEVPEEYGGQGLDKVSGAVIAEGVAKQGSFACTFLAHTGIGTLPIRFFGTEEQKRKYLSKLTSGEWVAAYSLTEVGAGSDANNVKTRAMLSSDGSHYIFNGEKKFVTNGGFADVYTVFAKIDGEDKITAFIVERGFSGVTVGKEEHKLGIQGSSTSDLVFQDAIVPVENLLGERGRGFKIAVNILNLGRFKLGAACLGAGRMCLDEALKYSKDRKQFGQPICNFGVIRQKLAQMAVKNYAMESMVYRLAGHLEEAIGRVDTKDSKAVLDAIEEFVVECSLTKIFCSEALDEVVDENVQIHGGSGFCEGNPERHYRDSRINRIFEGTNEINRMLLVGMLLKKSSVMMQIGALGKKIVEETMAPSLQSESEDMMDRLFGYLNGTKKSFLIVCDCVNDKFLPILDNGKELTKHQIVLVALADCLIEIYKLDSVLRVAQKNRNDLNDRMTRLVFSDSLFTVDRLIKELLIMCSDGDNQRTRLAMIRRLIKFTPENKEDLCNEIAEKLLAS